MARKALNLTYGLNWKGDLADQESNASKIDDTLAELDKSVVVLPLTPNGTTTVRIAKSGARTVSAIKAKRHTALASAGGGITLAVTDGDGNTLLSAATIDAEAFTASFVSKTLTATTANLDLADGEPIQLDLVSDNADATGGPAIVEITFAAS